MSTKREQWLELVGQNIERHGYHVTVVQQSEVPRFAYTIGLRDSLGFELVLPGAVSLLRQDALRMIRAARDGTTVVPEVGEFALGAVHPSWQDPLLLGALDVHGAEHVPARQVIPLGDLRTYDVPDLAQPWDARRERVWRWLHEPWDLPVPIDAKAVSDVEALRGAPITQAMRREDDTWELFSRDSETFPKEEVRIVPLGGLVGFDPTLEPVLDLPLEKGLLRDPPGPWRPWG